MLTGVSRQSDNMLRLIGAFKLLKALTLIAFAVFVLGHVHTGLGHVVRDLANEAGLAGTDRRIADLMHSLGVLEAQHGVAIGLGAIGYAALFLVEGVGLVLRKVWGEYISVIITTSFFPLEIYELVEKPSIVKVIIVALNVAIVVYLLLRLRKDGHWPFGRHRGTNGHAAGEALGDAAGH